jgi:hypothetical protein
MMHMRSACWPWTLLPSYEVDSLRATLTFLADAGTNGFEGQVTVRPSHLASSLQIVVFFLHT